MFPLLVTCIVLFLTHLYHFSTSLRGTIWLICPRNVCFLKLFTGLGSDAVKRLPHSIVTELSLQRHWAYCNLSAGVTERSVFQACWPHKSTGSGFSEENFWPHTHSHHTCISTPLPTHIAKWIHTQNLRFLIPIADLSSFTFVYM